MTDTPAKEVRWASSEDCENWHADNLGELLDELAGDEKVQAGRIVYVGDVRHLDKLRFLPSADEVIERIGEYAYDNGGGEHAEDWPEVSKEGKAALEAALHEWAKTHLPEPTFYLIENVRPYTITETDLQ